MPDAHRKQRWWAILVPMLIGLVLVIALAVLVVRAPASTVAHMAALLVACLAGGLFVLGLPVLAGLVWAILAWPRVYHAVPRYSARVAQAQERLRQRVLRLSDAAARLVIAPRVRWAQTRALVVRLKALARGARRPRRSLFP